MRQAGAVCVAEGDVLGPRLRRRPQAFRRVAGVLAPGIEEVLGVVDDALALAAAEGHRLGDHRQVLLTADLGHLLEVKCPGLADQGHDRRKASDQHRQRIVVLGGDVAAAGHAEGADGGVCQRVGGEQLEQLHLLRVGAWEAGLDVVHAEPVQGLGDVQLLARRERHALSLHAVPQGRVVELHLVHLMPSWFRGYGREAFRPGRAQARCRLPLGGSGGGNSPACLESLHQLVTLLSSSTGAGCSTKSSHSRYSSARP